jgi:hypothetical protein
MQLRHTIWDIFSPSYFSLLPSHFKRICWHTTFSWTFEKLLLF